LNYTRKALLFYQKVLVS